MEWSGWAAFALFALTNIIIIAVQWGSVRQQLRAVVDRFDRQRGRLNAHDDHIRDMNIHWTPRERDALVTQLKQLDRIEELIRESLADRAQIHKAIESILSSKNPERR